MFARKTHVDIDFHLLSIGNREGWKKWELLLPKIIKYIDRPYKEEPSKSALKLLKSSNVSQCQQICCVLLLLNNHLRPTKVTRTFKPSVLFAQEEIISFAETDEQVYEKVKALNAINSRYGIPSIARIVVRGKDLTLLAGIFEVHYNETIYKLDSAAKAIDVLVKLNSVLGLPFSRISGLVWNFICSFVYDLQIPEQYESIIKIKRYLDS
ncbi:uncharacterized protein LOC134215089 [Armigeres subalbatus]|uniref:uncharacterized protein LOC134215089 n=1 Tax=Armigeres subalbatus TaxID=124917 RepID=UPI002ED49FD7